jgi:phosphatidylglycerol:prolipoprotein diacylglycerol transferase
MQLAERKSPDGTKFQVVTEVQPHSIAELHGIQAGDRILLIAPPADVFLRAIKQAHIALSAPERNSLLVQRDGKPLVIVPAAELPDVSLPTFPAQLVSSINAFLICCLLWFYYPFRRRDGELMAMLLIVYSISRYLEEVIRVDEAGVFGTNLTISQWVSVICLVGGILMMIGLRVFASPAPANPSGAADF